MNSPEYLEAIMGLIMYGGEAKGFASQAIRAAKEGRIDEAEQLLQEASGESVELSLLMVHGQDHLMNALTFIDLAKEFVDLYKQIG